MTTTRQTSSDVEQECPPRQSCWQAHAKSVVGLQVINRVQRSKYILSASSDCTAKLWTSDRVLVGVFGQVRASDNFSNVFMCSAVLWIIHTQERGL